MTSKNDDKAVVDGMMKQAELPPAKIDPNDLLKKWQLEGMPPEHQVAMIEAMINVGRPLIEKLAEDAGEIKPADQDDVWTPEYEDAVDRVVEMASKLDAKELGKWESKLARKMGLTKRRFNEVLSGQRKSEKLNKGKKDTTVIPTFGGWLGSDKKWFVEYCYNHKSKLPHFAFRAPDGAIDEADELVIDGMRYQPMSPEEDLMISKRVVVFPEHVAKETHSTSEISYALERFIKSQCLLDDPKIPKVASYVILQSWIYDCFNQLAYLRAIGDKGSGKSEIMRRVGHLCYRLTKASGADSISTFFRTTTTYGGTVYFEEADLPEGSGADNPIIKFINLGAMRGNYILRSEEYTKADGSKGYRTYPFETYCPKLFSQREEYEDDAVGSRSLTMRLLGKETQNLLDANIPFEMNSSYWSEWGPLTSVLLRWRLERWRPEDEIREIDNKLIDPLVEPRLNQVAAIIKQLAAEDNDDVFLTQVKDVLRAQAHEAVIKRSNLIEARIVEALWKMYIYPDLRQRFVIKTDGRISIKIGDITAIANNIVDEMKEEGADLRAARPEGSDTKKKGAFEVSSHKVGKFVGDVLLLETPPRTGKGYFCIWDDFKMEVAGKKYGVLPDIEKIKDARTELAKLNARIDTREPLQMGLEGGE
jgi:hypothetical protein